ncbi:MAG TPA: hypothetical protein VL172_05255, partial [Kofleriaceae bacterium]|nr:hypothetical protein [Kofleriaceae bacterium]
MAAPGAGASRLALQVARMIGGALYPDPRGAAIGDLEGRLAALPPEATPVVVVDGPDPGAALAHLPALAGRALHPRLRVIIPVRVGDAPLLPALAECPRGSILVAALAGEARPPPRLDAGVPAAALLPLALAGRLPADAGAGDDLLIARGLAARDGAG